jgi:hypothetical protein
VPRQTRFHSYRKEDLAEMAKKFAQIDIIGNILYGSIVSQEIRWNDDSLEVITVVDVRKERIGG